MLIEVIKFTENRGVLKIPLDDYRVLPVEEDKFLGALRNLRDLGAYNLSLLSVELRPCKIDYATSMITFPFSGRREHITKLIYEKNNSYCEILKEEPIKYEDYL